MSTPKPLLTREEMEPFYQAELHLDAAIEEGDDYMIFTKVPTMEDPFIRGQKVAPPAFPHHYAGENFISLTGESAAVLLHHKGIIDDAWRGHGVRIRDAVFRETVHIGETLYVKVTLLKNRKLWGRLFAVFAFEMWKLDGDTRKICYKSEQEAVFFPAKDLATAEAIDALP